MTKLYEVEMRGEIREVYLVEADSEDEADQRWGESAPFISEASSMELYTIREVKE